MRRLPRAGLTSFDSGWPAPGLRFRPPVFLPEASLPRRPTGFGATPLLGLAHRVFEQAGETPASHLTVAPLRSGIGGNHPDDAVRCSSGQLLDHVVTQFGGEHRRGPQVEAQLGPTARPVGMLSPGTTRRIELPLEIPGRYPVSADGEIIHCLSVPAPGQPCRRRSVGQPETGPVDLAETGARDRRHEVPAGRDLESCQSGPQKLIEVLPIDAGSHHGGDDDLPPVRVLDPVYSRFDNSRMILDSRLNLHRVDVLTPGDDRVVTG